MVGNMTFYAKADIAALCVRVGGQDAYHMNRMIFGLPRGSKESNKKWVFGIRVWTDEGVDTFMFLSDKRRIMRSPGDLVLAEHAGSV